MDPQIFITYSSKDQKVARTICTALENRGLACWISSRNVQPGQNFQEQIVKAIRAAKIMVLVFTANANNSNEIKKELALASQNNLVVIPVRIEDVTPNEAFAYEFATRQWIDLFDDWENSIAHLVELIASTVDDRPSDDRVLAAPKRSTADTLSDAPAPRKMGWRSRRALSMAAVLGVVLVGSVGVWLVDTYRTQVPLAPSPVQSSQTTVPTQAPTAQPPPAPAPVQSPAPPVQPASGGVMPLSPERERALKPKDTFQECANCPRMMVVPAGSFTMGSPASEPGRITDEGPQHDVTIANPFAVGTFDVTRDEFAAFVTDTGYDTGSKCTIWNGQQYTEKQGLSWRNPGFEQTGSHPVVCISWNDAQAYVTWLNKKTGKDYRLLSESEWEYAARARSTTAYFWGNDIGNNNADCYACGSQWDNKVTAPVGSFNPNAFGLYDMAGNVWQWTQDCYHDSYGAAPADGSAWTSGDCSRLVFRGGSWGSNPLALHSAYRRGTTDVRASFIGFRVGRTLVAPSQTTVPTQAPTAQPAPAQTPAPLVPPATGGVMPLSPERERALKPKDSFKECEKCPEMVVIPAGIFTMGFARKRAGTFCRRKPTTYGKVCRAVCSRSVCANVR